MKTKKELPLVEPIFSTYHNAIFSACIKDNPTIRNIYLNDITLLTCTTKFLYGYSTPEIGILGTSFDDTPYLEKQWVSMLFVKGYTSYVIRNMIDSGFYVYFWGVDDYYVKGKSWYKEKHFNHDGAICGYDQENKTYCIYAYDSNWVYRKFWTPQKAFDTGRKAMFEKGTYGFVCGLKPLMEKFEFSALKAISKIQEYLESNINKSTENEEKIYGIEVHDYIAKYVGKLYDGSIPYERMDRRVLLVIWEHKKLMYERIKCIEGELGLNSYISIRYEQIVKETDRLRMLYAIHHTKRRDSILPTIQQKLLELKEWEFGLLRELIDDSKIVFKQRSIYGDRNY